MIRKIAAAAAACLFFSLTSSPAHCVDGVAAEIGYGEDSTRLLRVAVTSRWRKPEEPAAPQWRLAGYWELAAGVWDNSAESTADIALTPVFRFQRGSLYLEAAIGVHLVQTHISAQTAFTTSLQFGDHIGAGVLCGKYDLGVRLQHVSNAGLDHPNPGFNFVIARLQYRLD